MQYDATEMRCSREWSLSGQLVLFSHASAGITLGVTPVHGDVLFRKIDLSIGITEICSLDNKGSSLSSVQLMLLLHTSDGVSWNGVATHRMT